MKGKAWIILLLLSLFLLVNAILFVRYLSLSNNEFFSNEGFISEILKIPFFRNLALSSKVKIINTYPGFASASLGDRDELWSLLDRWHILDSGGINGMFAPLTLIEVHISPMKEVENAPRKPYYPVTEKGVSNTPAGYRLLDGDMFQYKDRDGKVIADGYGDINQLTLRLWLYIDEKLFSDLKSEKNVALRDRYPSAFVSKIIAKMLFYKSSFYFREFQTGQQVSVGDLEKKELIPLEELWLGAGSSKIPFLIRMKP